LGALHRERISGVLQVIVRANTHEIELRNGLVVRVTVAHESVRLGETLRRSAPDPEQFERVLGVALARSSDERPLGERLVATGAAASTAVNKALQELHQHRLNQLFCLGDARLRFRLLHRPTASGWVMGPAAFLHHRRRYRDRAKGVASVSVDVLQAYRTLGLTPGASLSTIKAAFRSLAVEGHPDKFASQGSAAFEAATRRFRRTADSYRLLVDVLSQG
jgi:DnaJ-domain-containing protein 1